MRNYRYQNATQHIRSAAKMKKNQKKRHAVRNEEKEREKKKTIHGKYVFYYHPTCVDMSFVWSVGRPLIMLHFHFILYVSLELLFL